MKVSQWLNENVSSHGIYDSEGAKKEFQKETGKEADWPEHSYDDAREGIHKRGMGGDVTPTDKKLSYGWEMADSLAREHANFFSTKMGRGFKFHDCVEALAKAGN